MTVIPIFVSSTFRDFHAERDALLASVLPALNDHIGEYGCRVEMIDLRWGVAADEGDAQHARVLEVCLAEIERARPLFLGLLGDRYGWVPDEFRLVTAAQEAGIDDYPSGISATALEFEYGALRRPRHESVFLNRRVDGAVPSYWRDGDVARIRELKARVRERCDVHDYRVAVDDATPVDLSNFVECAIRVLGPKVAARAQEIAGSGLDSVSAAESLFFGDRLRAFDGRADVVAAIVGALREGHGVCLSGESGIGKSSIWCAAVTDLAARGMRVVAVPIGASPEVLTLRSVLLRACTLLRSEAPQTMSVEELHEHLRSALRSAAPVILAIDGIDQIPGQPRPTFIADLPDGVTAFVSTTVDDQARYATATGLTDVAVTALDSHRGRSAVDAICASIGRTLPPAAVDRLTEAPRTPLWLRLAIGELSALDADAFATVNPSADPLAEIARLVVQRVAGLPSSTSELLAGIVDRAIGRFGEAAVAGVVSLTAVSRSGLRPVDYEALTELDVLGVASVRRGLSGLLVARGEGGRLGFAHSAVRAYVAQRFISPEMEIELHRSLADYLGRHEDNDPLCQEDRLWHLLRSDGVSAGPVLNAVTPERHSQLAAVILDSLSVPGATSALSNLDDNGIHFLTSVVLDYKSAMRSRARIMLSASIFAESQALVDNAESATDMDRAILAVAKAGGCLADLPSAVDVDLRPAAEEAYEFTSWLVAQYPESRPAHEANAQVATFFSREIGDRELARAARQVAADEWDWIASREPSLRVKSWMQFDLQSRGQDELEEGNLVAAREHFERSLPLAREVLAGYGDLPGAKLNIVNSLVGLAQVAAAEGNQNQTLRYFAEAVELAQSAYNDDPVLRNAMLFAKVARFYGIALTESTHLDAAGGWLAYSAELYRRCAETDSDDLEWVYGLDAAARAAVVDILLGNPQQARERIRSAVTSAAVVDIAVSAVSEGLNRIARARFRDGAHQVALAIVAEVLALEHAPGIEFKRHLRSALADAHAVAAQSWNALGENENAVASKAEELLIRRSLFEAEGGDDVALARSVGWALLELASLRKGARRVDVVHEIAAHWEQHLSNDVGVAGPTNQWLAQRLSSMAWSSPTDARVLLQAALRYVHELTESDPHNDDYFVDWVGVTQTVGLLAANGGDLSGAARTLMNVAAQMSQRQTTHPKLVEAATSLAASLRMVASKPGLDRDVAADCLSHAEQL